MSKGSGRPDSPAKEEIATIALSLQLVNLLFSVLTISFPIWQLLSFVRNEDCQQIQIYTFLTRVERFNFPFLIFINSENPLDDHYLDCRPISDARRVPI